MAMIDAVLADGRTVYRFRTRAEFVRLVTRDVKKSDEHRFVRCYAKWHREQEEFEPTRLIYIRPSSVAFIRVVEPPEREAFIEQFPDAAVERRDPAPAEADGPSSREANLAAAETGGV